MTIEERLKSIELTHTDLTWKIEELERRLIERDGLITERDNRIKQLEQKASGIKGDTLIGIKFKDEYPKEELEAIVKAMSDPFTELKEEVLEGKETKPKDRIDIFRELGMNVVTDIASMEVGEKLKEQEVIKEIVKDIDNIPRLNEEKYSHIAKKDLFKLREKWKGRLAS